RVQASGEVRDGAGDGASRVGDRRADVGERAERVRRPAEERNEALDTDERVPRGRDRVVELARGRAELLLRLGDVSPEEEGAGCCELAPAGEHRPARRERGP